MTLFAAVISTLVGVLALTVALAVFAVFWPAPLILFDLGMTAVPP